MSIHFRVLGAAACLSAGLLAVPPAAVGSTRAATGNPMRGNLGFGTIVEDNALLGSTETEGTVALGGNLTFGPGYNVMIHDTGIYTAPGESHPTALLVGGRINMSGSAPAGVLRVENNGYVHVGSTTGTTALDTDQNNAAVNTEVVAAGGAYNSTPRVELTTRETPSAVGPFISPIDFTSLFATYRQRARSIADCAENVTLTDAQGNALPEQSGFPAGTQGYVTLTPGRTNVLKLSGADLNRLSELTFRTPPSADTPFVVVVDPVASTYNWHVPNLAGVSGTQAPYMLWDFPTATTINLTSGDSLEGTIYAPSAHLTDLDASNIEGDIAVKSLDAGPLDGSGGYVNAGEIHNFPFAATLDCVRTSPSPTATTTSTASPTSTATATATATASPTSASTAVTPSPAPTGPSLAATGTDDMQLLAFGLIGTGVLLSGSVLFTWGRRRRSR